LTAALIAPRAFPCACGIDCPARLYLRACVADPRVHDDDQYCLRHIHRFLPRIPGSNLQDMRCGYIKCQHARGVLAWRKPFEQSMWQRMTLLRTAGRNVFLWCRVCDPSQSSKSIYLNGFTGFYWVFLDPYWLLPSFVEFYLVSLGCTRFYWVLVIFSRSLLVITEFY